MGHGLEHRVFPFHSMEHLVAQPVTVCVPKTKQSRQVLHSKSRIPGGGNACYMQRVNHMAKARVDEHCGCMLREGRKPRIGVYRVHVQEAAFARTDGANEEKHKCAQKGRRVDSDGSSGPWREIELL